MRSPWLYEKCEWQNVSITQSVRARINIQAKKYNNISQKKILTESLKCNI